MELLDLTDDALIHIFSYLDHYSKLDTMLVCRRFELLIGQNAQFYNNFKLKLVGKRSRASLRFEKNEKFMFYGRYFGDVYIRNYYFNLANQLFPSLMKTFDLIGPNISKLKIEQSEGSNTHFLDVLRHANNVKELTIRDLTMYSISKKLKKKNLQHITFPNLRSLELNSIRNFEIIEEVFHPVALLHHLNLASIVQKDWEMFQKLLIRQEDLRSLELDHVVVDNFEWRHWNIEKLTLREVRFPKKEAFQSFTEFVKTLSNVQELRLDVTGDERENHNNYTEILTHFLKLPSLRILELKCENELNMRIQNPAVKIFGEIKAHLAKFFYL